MSPLLKLLDRVLPPTGNHRLVPGRIHVELAGLNGPQLPPLRFPLAPAHDEIDPQAFRHCSPCGRDVAVDVHPSDAHTCRHGHLTLPTTTALGD